MLILVRPHTSLLDGPRIAWTLYRRGLLRCVFPVDVYYARHPVWGALLRAYGRLCGHAEMRAMDRTSPFALRELARLLQRGRIVVVFPQGTGLADSHRPDQDGWRWLVRRCPGIEVQELHL